MPRSGSHNLFDFLGYTNTYTWPREILNAQYFIPYFNKLIDLPILGQLTRCLNESSLLSLIKFHTIKRQVRPLSGAIVKIHTFQSTPQIIQYIANNMDIIYLTRDNVTESTLSLAYSWTVNKRFFSKGEFSQQQQVTIDECTINKAMKEIISWHNEISALQQLYPWYHISYKESITRDGKQKLCDHFWLPYPNSRNNPQEHIAKHYPKLISNYREITSYINQLSDEKQKK